jgi:hypothetical protein
VANYRDRCALLAVGAIAAVGATHLVDFGVYDLRYRIFNANSDASWSHVVVTGVLAVGAAVCLVGAKRLPEQRATWVATAVVLTPLFFVGVASGVHSEIDAVSHGRLLYAPVLAVLVYCVWRLTRGGPYFAVVSAGAALLLASYVVHVLEPHNIARALGWRVGGWGFQVVVVVKEGAELAGVLLALLALWSTATAPQVHARGGR